MAIRDHLKCPDAAHSTMGGGVTCPNPSRILPYPIKDIPKHLKSFQQCSINNIRSQALSFGADATALTRAGFY